MNEVLILITTESNEKIAKNIAKLLIQKKLAACVSTKHINSIFKWEDAIEEIEEIEITIKSKPALREQIILFVQKMSSYEVPQIIFKKFYAESEYHDWLIKTI